MKSNELAQQTSGYHATYGVSHIPQKPMICFTNIGKAGLKPTASATNERSSAGEDEDHARIVVGEVHEGICDIHQSSDEVVVLKGKYLKKLYPSDSKPGHKMADTYLSPLAYMADTELSS